MLFRSRGLSIIPQRAEMGEKQATMRRGRKLILGLVGVLVVALALLILAPSLVTWGVGRGAIRGAIEGRINGTVGLQTLRVAWFGPQEVTGFSITGDDGRTSGTVVTFLPDASIFASAGAVVTAAGSSVAPRSVGAGFSLDARCTSKSRSSCEQASTVTRSVSDAGMSFTGSKCTASSTPGPPRSILVTSPRRREGKTTIAANLAIVAARVPGRGVVLVDADPRGREIGRAHV